MSNRKYPSHLTTLDNVLPNGKRKSSDAQNKSSIHSDNISTKPYFSEYVNPKCMLYIYYKGDVLNIIDDHFKKSFNSIKSWAMAPV